MSHVASVGPAHRLATSPRETQSAPDIAGLLRRVVDAAVVGFSWAAHACVHVVGPGGPSTVVFSDDLALTIFCRQHQIRSGAHTRKRSWNSGRRFERLDLQDAVADQAKNLVVTMRGVA